VPVRQTKYGYSPKAYPPAESRKSIFEPVRGLDAGQAPQELSPGFTPESQNWIHVGGYLQPRSGISRYDNSFTLGDAALYAFEAFDVENRRYAIVASSDTLAILPASGTSWSALSYVAGSSGQTASAVMNIGWHGDYIYDIARDENIAVLTNDRQLPKFLTLTPSVNTFSDFTWVSSRFSHARSVTVVDNSLVWFNVSTSTQQFPQRVEVSVRGEPSNYAQADGAVFEDIMDMRGVGQRAVADGDNVVLFTDQQIWRGRKTGDNYRFSYYCVNRTLGSPYPKTIASTPRGIMFLGGDLEMYLLSGDETIRLGPTYTKGPDQGDHSRIQTYLQRRLMNGSLAWGAYNDRDNAYEMFYTSNETNTNLYPKNRIGLYFDNMSFFESRFSHELSAGCVIQDIEEAVTWDSIPYTWDQFNVPWDTASLGPVARRHAVFSSSGTPYRFRSDQTSDDGTAIQCNWRSHGLNQGDEFRFDQLHEVWIEYASDSNSSLSLMVSDTVGSSFIDGYAANLSSSSHSVVMCPVHITAQSPVFELRLNDGSVPKISRLQARLRDAGAYGGGL
jgi:hypothetical protein